MGKFITSTLSVLMCPFYDVFSGMCWILCFMICDTICVAPCLVSMRDDDRKSGRLGLFFFLDFSLRKMIPDRFFSNTAR